MAELVYAPIVTIAPLVFAGLGLDLDVQGAENIPRTGGAIIASNHVSYLDFIFVGLGAHPAKRYVRFMAKDSVWKHPVGGPLMRGMKHIPVNREAGAESFKVALEAARSGEVVGPADLDLEDVVFGAEKQFSHTLAAECPVCHGTCAAPARRLPSDSVERRSSCVCSAPRWAACALKLSSAARRLGACTNCP